MSFFDYKYYPDDPIEKIPLPVGKIILSFIGIVALFATYVFLWGAILSV